MEYFSYQGSASTVKEDFRIFVDTAVKNGYEDVLSRVIVQIYYKEMYDEVMSVYDFEHSRSIGLYLSSIGASRNSRAVTAHCSSSVHPKSAAWPKSESQSCLRTMTP